ncbi:Coproporphyrinogen oxidase [Sistotremastrum suecicum HHB10207 ss-3]|uniref:coproporphyrinogen oxidase n=1 Tax=Sistotremastrum suecicum HHB10207 ss-3 TaxID=1314776 RepID=A0A166IFF6_9AGAM|nr:Coproporphyrinogen oxidase [Sistotremastrum suecicum HHB10207 ss-3]
MAATKPMRDQVTDYIISLQTSIVEALEKLDPSAAPFKRDSWVRSEGGLGQSCVFAVDPESKDATAHQTILEKAGVNISVVHGQLPPKAIAQMRADHSEIPYDPESGKSLPFFAAGLSLVIHPRNPHAPTVHANYRYFEISEAAEESDATPPQLYSADKAQGKVIAWWFGGGSDLTPSYLYPEDAAHFHDTLKSACDPHHEALYPAFKKWCDEYFYIPHRKETRGIGGIFFDDLSPADHKRLSEEANKTKPKTPEDIFAFVQSCGNSFIQSYVPILEKRHATPWTDTQRRWQLIRRGRYVEFNLVYDRGTKFGLQTPGARIESILMSLPEIARWEYMSDMGTQEDTEEAKLLAVLREPKEWATTAAH